MQMDLMIRKHTFNFKFNGSYFGNFTELLTLDLSNDLIETLFSFLGASQNLTCAVRPLITNEEGYPILFFREELGLLQGYSTLGFKDISIFDSRMKQLPEYQTMIENINNLWNLLGWTMSDPKVVKIEVGNFNQESAMYAGYPTTYDQIHSLWTGK